MRTHPTITERCKVDWATLFRLARVHPDDEREPLGMTPFGLRVSRAANGVSARHGEVARGMWRELYPGRAVGEVPIGHVTNGVHVLTWMGGPMRALLDRHLGADWPLRMHDPATWAGVDDIPDQELWLARRALRLRLIDYVREHATVDRLARGEDAGYVDLASHAFNPDHLTLGFARRLATYKRMYLLSRNLPRALALLAGERPVQIVLAGKAHPQDEGAKRVVQTLFNAKRAPHVGEQIAYLHDYDMAMAHHLVSGCDVWLNFPRPPLEASGTSGMKAALNGGLNLSVRDGWWVEGYDGTNGWAIESDGGGDPDAGDDRDTDTILDLLQHQVVPRFYERDAEGLPRAWLAMVRSSIKVAGLRFGAQRMLSDYVARVYRTGPADGDG
jgi:starch phosphorylase